MNEKPKYCQADEPGKHAGVGLITLEDESLICRAHKEHKDFVERELVSLNECELGSVSQSCFDDVLDAIVRFHWAAAASSVAQMNRARGHEQAIQSKGRQKVVRMTRSAKKAPRHAYDDANIERIVGLGFAVGAA